MPGLIIQVWPAIRHLRYGSDSISTQTTKSRLLYYSLVDLAASPIVYRLPLKTAAGPSGDFAPGSGEGADMPGLALHAEGIIELPEQSITACEPSATPDREAR